MARFSATFIDKQSKCREYRNDGTENQWKMIRGTERGWGRFRGISNPTCVLQCNDVLDNLSCREKIKLNYMVKPLVWILGTDGNLGKIRMGIFEVVDSDGTVTD